MTEAKTALGQLGDGAHYVSKESEWRYFYSVAADANWFQPGFDDSGWAQGTGQFGYGDDDESTLLSWGSDPDNKPITAYFRKSFTVKSLDQVRSLAVDLLRDDGGVVYLNGQEVLRDNMPKGVIQFSTEAPASPKKSDENLYHRMSISPDLLREGKNVIAVEVHQSDPDSSDLSFDLQLVSNLPSVEEAVRSIDISALKGKLTTCTPPLQLDDWGWELLDQARQPKVRENVILFENGFKIDTNDLAVPDILRRSNPRIVLPPTAPQ
jgi:hypothetical protein